MPFPVGERAIIPKDANRLQSISKLVEKIILIMNRR